ncbi:aldo/keto reductase family domain-containing protein [Rhizoctonia solani AG-1 IA]|uniref:Aldo/keto reductase family domain-containing protein n=1 Tax=Thanatephorus cucumeris (strain AG1-IA) TaxID=983506 RepID=L8X109_THACA|nr:aldo/keto reductase family domain-containing protein [Rhizoctonia solani AG-1 IA]
MAQTAVIADSPIVKIGHGLMSVCEQFFRKYSQLVPALKPTCMALQMSWVPEPPSDEQSFASIKAGIEAAPPGAKVFLNSGRFETRGILWEFTTDSQSRAFEQMNAALHLIAQARSKQKARFVRTGPVSGMDRWMDLTMAYNGSGKNSIDPKVPIEQTMATLNRYAHISNTYPVIATARELGITVIAYSPLGRGFLTGKFNPEGLSKQDHRSHIPRLQGEAVKANMNLVKELGSIAKRKKVTLAQLCLAWVCSIGPHVVPIPSSTRAERTLENFSAASIALTEEDHADINHALNLYPVSGARYSEGGMKLVWG